MRGSDFYKSATYIPGNTVLAKISDHKHFDSDNATLSGQARRHHRPTFRPASELAMQWAPANSCEKPESHREEEIRGDAMRAGGSVWGGGGVTASYPEFAEDW